MFLFNLLFTFFFHLGLKGIDKVLEQCLSQVLKILHFVSLQLWVYFYNSLSMNLNSFIQIFSLSQCECTFSPYILAFFHFGPYIFISSLLVPKSINACYLVLFVSQQIEITEVTNGGIKILLKIYYSTPCQIII